MFEQHAILSKKVFLKRGHFAHSELLESTDTYPRILSCIPFIEEWHNARKEDSVILALDYEIIRKTRQQQTIDLLNQWSSVSLALREVRTQKRALFVQRPLFFQKRLAFSEQLQVLSKEESILLQELLTIQAELAALRK